MKRIRGMATIRYQQEITQTYREARLDYPDGLHPPLPEPGQFFMLVPTQSDRHVMSRPLAYSFADRDGFSFIYEIRGQVTRDISALASGEKLDWIGPLGTGFPGDRTGQTPILVAGGIGLGPILFLAKHFLSSGIIPVLVFGAKTEHQIPCISWPGRADLHICTEDGSSGIKGTVLDVLDNLDDLATMDIDHSTLYTCGPAAMMKAVHRFSEKTGNRCYVSMEEVMACGVGACQGCAVRMVGSDPVYSRVCDNGPVFLSDTVNWDSVS